VVWRGIILRHDIRAQSAYPIYIMHGCDGNPGMGAIRASSTGPVFTTRMRLRTVTENEHAPCETTIRSHPGIKVDDCGISDDRYLLRSASLPPAARVGGHVQRPSTRKLRRAPRTRRSMPNINGTCIDHVNEERGRENKIYGSSVKSCNVRQTLPQKMSPPVRMKNDGFRGRSAARSAKFF